MKWCAESPLSLWPSPTSSNLFSMLKRNFVELIPVALWIEQINLEGLVICITMVKREDTLYRASLPSCTVSGEATTLQPFFCAANNDWTIDTMTHPPEASYGVPCQRCPPPAWLPGPSSVSCHLRPASPQANLGTLLSNLTHHSTPQLP